MVSEDINSYMAFILLLIFSALAVSSVAAYFSIVGLITIFPAAAMSILSMGIALEIAKLVTASWLYRYWETTGTLMKMYFVPAVLVLSLITSIGIFGFLSRAHIDQESVGVNKDLNIEVIEFRLDAETSKLRNAQSRIAGLDDTLATSLGKDKNYVNRTQREERLELNEQIDEAVANIDALNLELLPLRREIADLDAELGPIKYISELFYGESTKESVDRAVRIIILLLIFVFDPLAILLVIAANKAWLERKGEIISFTNFSDEAVEVVKEEIGFSYPEPPSAVDDAANVMSKTEDFVTTQNEDWVSVKYGDIKKAIKKGDLSWLIDKKRNK